MTTTEARPDFQIEASDEERTPLSGMTLTQYKELFRTVARGGAQQHDVDTDIVDDVLSDLGMGHSGVQPSPGMVVMHGDYRLIESLPEDSALEVGDRADGHAAWSLWGISEGETQLLLGGLAAYSHMLMRLLHAPGLQRQGWVDQEPDDDDASAIRDFQVQAWDLCSGVREDNDWCGIFDSVMEAAMLSSQVRRRQPWLDPEAVRVLAEGTVLRYHAPTGESVFYRRDDSADNPCRTSRLCGGLPGSWSQKMMAVSTGNLVGLRIPAWSKQAMRCLPLGSQVDVGGAVWTKDGALWTSRYGGTAPTHHFTSTRDIVITRIGEQA